MVRRGSTVRVRKRAWLREDGVARRTRLFQGGGKSSQRGHFPATSSRRFPASSPPGQCGVTAGCRACPPSVAPTARSPLAGRRELAVCRRSHPPACAILLGATVTTTARPRLADTSGLGVDLRQRPAPPATLRKTTLVSSRPPPRHAPERRGDRGGRRSLCSAAPGSCHSPSGARDEGARDRAVVSERDDLQQVRRWHRCRGWQSGRPRRRLSAASKTLSAIPRSRPPQPERSSILPTPGGGLSG